jgi:hypothetical protein
MPARWASPTPPSYASSAFRSGAFAIATRRTPHRQVVERHARLDAERETRFVPEAREARTDAQRHSAFNAWARRISPEIERAIAEAGLGAGAYPLCGGHRASVLA